MYSSKVPVVRIHVCPRGCGWTRTYQQNQWWMEQWIDHQIYGKITNKTLVELDIADHDCAEHVAARNRAIRRRKNK